MVDPQAYFSLFLSFCVSGRCNPVAFALLQDCSESLKHEVWGGVVDNRPYYWWCRKNKTRCRKIQHPYVLQLRSQLGQVCQIWAASQLYMLVPTGFTWMNPNCETSVRQIWAVGLRFHSLSTHTTNRFYRPSHGAPVSPNLVTGSNLSCTGLLRLGVTKPSVVCVDSEWNLNPTAHILPTDVSPLGYIHGKPARGTLYVAHLILAGKNKKQ